MVNDVDNLTDGTKASENQRAKNTITAATMTSPDFSLYLQ
jgi:hypothetical protein